MKNLILLGCFLLFTACSKEEGKLRVIASATPHSELLEVAKEDLEKDGIPLLIIVSDDYNTPNRAVANGEADANFFQHQPFLESEIKAFNYPLVSIAAIEIEPMGLYSKKWKTLNEVKDKATFAIPSDPTNEARALYLIEEAGLITLKKKENPTPLDIVDNPHQLKFLEIDAAMLPRTLDDVDVAVINANYALQAHLTQDKALLLESTSSPFANVLVVRKGDEERKEIIALKKALTSEKMRRVIQERYKGAIKPAF